jgi:DNA-binding MarR family transcriptional regulator
VDDFYSLGLLLNRASIALAKSMNAALENGGIDLPHSQFIVLRCLYYKDCISQSEVANLLSKDAAAIKRTIDNLEKKGLVERHRIRNLKNSVCITDKGKSLMPQVLKIAENLVNEVIGSFKPENRKLLRTMLDDIYTKLKNKNL